MTRALVVAAILVASCKSEGETTDETIEAKGSSATGSGGFSAALSAGLSDVTGGSGSAAGSASTTAAGSGSAAAAGSGSAAAAGSGSAAGSASTTTAAGSGSAVAAGSGSAAGSASTTTAAGSGSAAAAGSGSASTTTTTAAGSASGSASTPTPTPPTKGPVVVPAELKAIQLSLLPNWNRDVGAAGTISLEVNVQSRGVTETFTFRYGYDEPGAPTDRDAYKKFLAEKKILKISADRQRGAAWYMEGSDGAGKPAFRFLVNYGGKRLVCYGSLYKDSSLGDIRDEVVIQAKKICETLTL